MSNWAKLQEDLVGLPVAKRAKHGIHFQKGANEFVANFSGKPCHHFADGIWKPIDTKLVLLPDGFYGCPHSKVKVHPDGRVKVEGTDYLQRTELPSASAGLADNDKLVREFSFGKQELRITEVGFKSEITLNRIPTLTEARKLIASESGTLSKKYLKSLTTATDANGDTHTYSTFKAFRTWLAKAVFPVVIDPDFTGISTLGDVCLGDSGYAPRNSGALTFVYSNYVANLFRFDLSSVSSSATVSAGTLGLTKINAAGTNAAASHNIYKITDANGDWVEGTGNFSANAAAGQCCYNAKVADGSGGVTTAWAGSAGLGTAGTDYVNTKLCADLAHNRTDAQYTVHKFTFNSDGYAVLQSWCGDATNNGLLVKKISGGDDTQWGTAEHATESYRPVLTVTYTAAGTFIPINMSAQMQSLTGGMRG
jgi:hypothetical protein